MGTINLKFMPVIFYIFIFLLPIQDFTNYVFYIPRSFQLLHIFVLLGVGYCILLYKKYGYLKGNKTVIILYGVYTLLSVISTLVNLPRLEEVDTTLFPNICFGYNKFWDSTKISPWYRGVFKPCEMLLFIIIIFSLSKIKYFKEKALYSIMLLAVCTSLYGIYQLFAFKYNLPFGSIFNYEGGQTSAFSDFGVRRISGMFFEGGSQAVFLVIPWCILLSQLFEKGKYIILKNKIFTSITFILSTIALIFTFSPIAYVAMSLGIVVYFIFSMKYIPWMKIIKNRLLWPIFIIVIISVLSLFLSNYGEKSYFAKIIEYVVYKIKISLFEMSDPIIFLNEDSRSIRAYGGIQAFLSAPLFGIGPGNGGYFYWSLVPFVSSGIMLLFCPFINDYVCVLAEQGIFSFIIFMAFILYPLYFFWKNKKISNPYKNVVYGMLAGYIVTIVASLQSFNYTKLPAFWIFYILLILFIKTKTQMLISEIKNDT